MGFLKQTAYGGNLDVCTRRLDQEILQFIHQHQFSKKSSESSFNQLFLKIFSYQYHQNSAYRQFCDISKKNPQNVVSWWQAPAMPVEGFKYHRLSTFLAKNTVRSFRTSGTTRGVLRGRHDFDTLKLYATASMISFHKNFLWDYKKMRCFFLTASPEKLKDSSLSWMMGEVRHGFSLPGSAFYVRREKVEVTRLIRDLSRLKTPAAILATAFSLASLLDEMTEKKVHLRLPKGSRLMETGGFKGRVKEMSKQELYSKVKKHLGISRKNCVSEYGMTELSSQFYNRGDGVFKVPAWVRVRITDPATGREVMVGKPGVVSIWDLANRGSVAAIQTEDLGVRWRGGFKLLGRAPKSALRGCSLTYEELSRK